ncbi:MAG: hypothetical protein IPO90_13205 [Flavobacteriales bacterium]|nr:hypothetical protein [Flavobacteriales bacterium]
MKILLLSAVFIQWTLRIRSTPRVLWFFYAQLALAFLLDNAGAVLVARNEENAWLYKIYVTMEFLILSVFAQESIRSRWSMHVCAIVVLTYSGILAWEIQQGSANDILNSISLLFAMAILVAAFTYLLVRLAGYTDVLIWREPTFWIYLSIVVFMGAGIPYLGLMNRIYLTNSDLADRLFDILSVLYFLRYGMVLYAGYLLSKSRTVR